MICPYCRANDDRVIDSRASDAGKAIRRRRVCNLCGKRFTTYERAETAARLMVVKRDGSRQPFDPERILAGIEVACRKLPISADARQRLVDDIDEEIHREFDREVPSSVIGQRVANRLRKLHQVAYVRFASVYRRFKDLDELIDEAREVKEQSAGELPGQGELFSTSANPASTSVPSKPTEDGDSP